MSYEHDPCIAEYEHEKTRYREADALQTLRKVASLVKPIMRQRGWRVGVLTEFYPPEHNLLGLNWNKGQKICLRLRHPGDERQFIPIEQVVDTMLHELCHIVHGPHNEAFHKLWDQLRDEHESLVRKGYTGEGFLSTGYKLGGRRIPMHEARRLARAAAEKRRTLGAGSGQRLGGAPIIRGSNVREIIANAATRRSRATTGCASERMNKEREREIVQGTKKNSTRTKADVDDPDEEAIMIAFIDLIQQEEQEKQGNSYRPPSKENPLGSQSAPIPIPSSSRDNARRSPPRVSSSRNNGRRSPLVPSSLSWDNARRSTPVSSSPSRDNARRSTPVRSSPSRDNARRSPPVASSSKPAPKSSSPRSSTKPTARVPASTSSRMNTAWTCDICTLVNPWNDLYCGACEVDRPEFPATSTTIPLSTSPPRTTKRTTTTSSRPFRPPQQRVQSSPSPSLTTNNVAGPRANILKNRNGVGGSSTLTNKNKQLTSDDEAIARAERPQERMGWTCYQCGTFMLQEWWTCTNCSSMKLSS